jgi:hypothetical protein
MKQVSNRYYSERCGVVFKTVMRYADPDDGQGPGSISTVNFGLALSELGGIKPAFVKGLLESVPAHRNGALKWREVCVCVCVCDFENSD